jgi:glycosyltransferase involved in cell wall biosynthesis
MKVCYLGNTQSIHLRRWADFFTQEGIDTSIISTVSSPPEREVTYQLKKLPLPGVRNCYQLFQLKQFLKKIHPDILHSFDVVGCFLGVLSHFRPHITTLWNDEEWLTLHYRSFWKNWALKYSVRKVDIVTADYQPTLQFIRTLGCPEEKLRYVVGGVERRFFSYSPKETELKELRKDLQIKPSTFVITSLRSTREPYYNIHRIIEIIPEILKNFSDTIFLFLDEPALLEKYSLPSNILSHIRFMRVPHQKMPLYLKLSTLALSIPETDATSISVLESMACGVPLIVSDIPSNRVWIKDMWNGLVINQHNPNALCSAIEKLLSNAELRRVFGERSAQQVKEKASFEEEMGKLKKIYLQLTSLRN